MSYLLLTASDALVIKKDAERPITIQVCEIDTISSQDTRSDRNHLGNTASFYSSPSYQTSRQFPQYTLEQDAYQPPEANIWDKVAEGIRLAYTRSIVAQVSIPREQKQTLPISEAGKFNHCYTYPLDNRYGKNARITLGRWAPRLRIRDGNGTQQTVIQAASHNYAGFYGLSQDVEELQRLALDTLPVADSYAVPSLEAAVHDGIARHFSADFCYTTSTGYGSNLLAFSAVLNKDWLVMVDDKCHNSMHVAAYMSQAGLVKKYPHGNFGQMEAILSEYKGKYAHILVAIEGFYSMDGTVPALDVLASLKSRHNFTLLADEAHSLLCLGATGRGAIEVWNEQHPAEPVSIDLFDLRTGTLSKSIGAIGGIVFGKAQFASAVLARRDEMLAAGYDPLPTSSMIQTLHVLDQTTRLQRQLRRLIAITVFVREELRRAGVHVYGNAISPILPVYAGRPSTAAKMSYTLRKAGLLATPVSTPAVPFWESRVRVCLSADHDNDTVHGLVAAIVSAARLIGLTSTSKFQPAFFDYVEETPLPAEAVEARTSTRQIRELINKDTVDATKASSELSTLSRGHDSRLRYGLGSGGARWITGTSQLHLDVERLAAMFQNTSEAMTYPDTYIGLMSTVAALSRPVMGFKTHVFLIPKTADQAITDGFRVASRKGAPAIQQYGSKAKLIDRIRQLRSTAYVTIYIDSSIESNAWERRKTLNEVALTRGRHAMTILLHDNTSMKDLPRHKQLPVIPRPQYVNHHFLIFSSLYRTFGLPGAYLAGSLALIKELRYTSRGYMFTTSQQPFIMGMAAAELERMLGLQDKGS